MELLAVNPLSGLVTLFMLGALLLWQIDKHMK